MKHIFFKKNKGSDYSFDVRVMHWVNRFAVAVFAMGVLYKLIDYFFLKK